jgi:hypothetical protein
MTQSIDFTKPESGVTTFGELYAIIRNHIESCATNFRGTTFPSNPKEGQFCLRSDYNPDKLYVYFDSAWQEFEEILGSAWTFYPERALFTFNGAATAYTIKVGPAAYYVKEKWAYWTSEITTAAISSPADGFYYLYLDYSAITSRTVIANNTPFVWSTTAPSYNSTYRGWYNGDDRCIFAVLADVTGFTNIFPFIHSGDYVEYIYGRPCGQTARLDEDYSSITPSNTWDDVYCPIPPFCGKVNVMIKGVYTDTETGLVIKPSKDLWSGDQYTYIGYVYSGAPSFINILIINISTSGIFELKWIATTAGNQVDCAVAGWYFPRGM